jgi:heme-degrading monooxygenase HmoA
VAPREEQREVSREEQREVSRWEVLKMIVRMASVQVAPERIDYIVSGYREPVRSIHQRSEGLLNHYVLVDRHSGQMTLIGFWDSQEALEAAIPTLEPARERLWNSFQETPTLEAYEIAVELWEVRH